VASRLKNDIVSQGVIVHAFYRAAEAEPALIGSLRADIAAVVERDPATERFIEPFLYFKGFHALQTHRLANWLWRNGERDFALYLQSRSALMPRAYSPDLRERVISVVESGEET